MWFWQFFITHFTFGRSATKCSLFIYKKYIICDSGKRTMKWCGKHLKRTPRALKGSRWLFRCDSYGVRSSRPLFRCKVRTSLQRPHFKENRLLPFTTSFENCRLHSGRHGNVNVHRGGIKTHFTAPSVASLVAKVQTRTTKRVWKMMDTNGSIGLSLDESSILQCLWALISLSTFRHE